MSNSGSFSDLDRAAKLAINEYKDKKDESGELYINQIKRVARRGFSNKAKTVAILNEMIKKNDLTFNTVEYIGFSKDVVASVGVLTRGKNELYSNYINRILNSDDSTALTIKARELKSEISYSKLKQLDPSTQEKLRDKYVPTIQALRNQCRIVRFRRLFGIKTKTK